MIIINLHKSLVADKPDITCKEILKELSKKTGIGVGSIKSILAEYKYTKTVKSPCMKKNRPKLSNTIGDIGKNAIREKIYSFWLNREFPTLEKIVTAVSNDENIRTLKRSTMYELLKEIGFVFTRLKKVGVITDRNDIILDRRKYLKEITKYRDEGRTIYYLDEMCFNVGDCLSTKIKSEFKLEKDSLKKKLTTVADFPTEKGKQLTAIHIGSKRGFVDGGLIFFESKTNDTDCHREINSHTFLEWFQNLLPWLDDQGVIVMDNAPYHCVKQSKCPTATWKKAEIIQWLLDRSIEFEGNLLKVELLDLVEKHKKPHENYVVDEVAVKQNKIVLRLPQNHCGLNPIERVWSIVEDYMKSNNTTFELNDVKQLLMEGLNLVTEENWANFEKQTIDKEQRIWDLDNIMDEMMDQMDPMIVPAGISSPSDNEVD